ncbi:g5909 [Coccomyxa elongata]
MTRFHVLAAVWALVFLPCTMRASSSRALLQGITVLYGTLERDSLGLFDCADVTYYRGPLKYMGNTGAVLAASCPHDGQRYSVCLGGPAVRGCRLQSQGLFPDVDCESQCGFQST